MKQLACAAFLVSLAACSGASVDPFIGTWTVGGNSSLTMSGKTETNSGILTASQYTLVMSRGTTSDLSSLDTFGCKLQWSVSGATATLVPNQTCTLTPQGGGTPSTIAITMGGITLTTVDATHLSGSGTLGGMCAGTSCSADVGGTLTKTP
jgi:hypothetical protein